MQHENADTENKREIANYYDKTAPFYRVFWHGNTGGVHYGYFDEQTTSLKEALTRMNEKVAELLKPKRKECIADLGCGVGGTAIWIAQRYGVHVDGVTLSKRQYRTACKRRGEKGLESKVNFYNRDFFKTGLPDGYYDAVYGLESLCYAQHDPVRISKELFRITKPGGRVVVADGYLGKEQLSAREQKDIHTFCEGFALLGMCTSTKFMAALSEEGFTNLSFVDWNNNVLETSRRMYRMSRRWHWFIWLYTMFVDRKKVILKNNRSGLVQKRLFQNRTLVYGAIYAEKPKV